MYVDEFASVRSEQMEMNKVTVFSATVLLGASTLFAGCNGSGSAPTLKSIDPPLSNASTSGVSNANSNLWNLIDMLPHEDLSDAELAALSLMREEEKLARDTYLYLYDIWGSAIFDNIAESEQRHTDAVLRLIQKYDLTDPAENDLLGVFADSVLQGLYDSLSAQGTPSLMDALIVGATIEDLDIFDLHNQMAIVDNEDITVVFESLLRGSRNHLRAFSARLNEMNVVYTPLYISQAEYDSIVNSPMETGQ